MANPTLLKRAFASNDAGTHTIPDTSSDPEIVTQTGGWGSNYSIALGSGGYAPKRVDMNSVFNMLSNILFYCQKGFTFEYDAGQDYYAGCIIRDSGELYYCHTSVNSGQQYHKPSQDTLQARWRKLGLMFDNTPVGTVTAWAGDTTMPGVTIPDGWVLCDGRTLNTASYSELFNVIGYKYGGSGAQFNVPNLVQKFIEGTDGNSGATINAGLPNITGNLHWNPSTEPWPFDYLTSQSGALSAEFNSAHNGTHSRHDSGWPGYKDINFDASKSNAIYGNSNTVQPPAVYMRYIIKYKKG